MTDREEIVIGNKGAHCAELPLVNRTCHARLLFIAATLGVILLVSCSAPHAGPKLIEADGVTYAACGGALWVQNENPRNIEPITFEVLFQDAQGVNHELKGVRMLKVSDLDSDSPACQR